MNLASESASLQSSPSSELSSTGKILMYVIGGVTVGATVFYIPFNVLPALRRICLPYVPATTEQILGITKALAGRSGRLLDVGSGDGRIVFNAAKLGFQADGVELNPWLVFYSRFAALLNSDYRGTSFYLRDLWKFDLKPYNNIVVFGVEEMMKDFEKKLLEETDNDTVVVSCGYPLPNMIPVETIGSGVETIWKYLVKR